jgi:hypothetical protein
VVENEVMSPNELLKALKWYLEKSGETERAVALVFGRLKQVVRTEPSLGPRGTVSARSNKQVGLQSRRGTRGSTTGLSAAKAFLRFRQWRGIPRETSFHI